MDLGILGLGVVDLEGVPFLPNGADTIIERLDPLNPFDVCPTPPCTGTIDIELVALHLTSIDPIDLTPLGGPFIGVFADLHATVNEGGAFAGIPQPDALNPSIGQMEISHDFLTGGTFDSCFGELGDPGPVCGGPGNLGVVGGGVWADAIFTIVGGDPSNPFDVLFSAPAPRLAIWSEDSQWQHGGGGQGDFQVTDIEDMCTFPPCHGVEPIVAPEPFTGLLVGSGLLLLAATRRRLAVRR